MSSICPHCKEINEEWVLKIKEIHSHYDTIIQSITTDYNNHIESMTARHRTTIDTLSETRNIISLSKPTKEPDERILVKDVKEPLEQRITYLEESLCKKSKECLETDILNKEVQSANIQLRKDNVKLRDEITRLEKMYDQLLDNHKKEHIHRSNVLEKYTLFYKDTIDGLLTENEHLKTELRTLRRER